MVSEETQLVTLKNHIELLPSTFDPANGETLNSYTVADQEAVGHVSVPPLQKVIGIMV